MHELADADGSRVAVAGDADAHISVWPGLAGGMAGNPSVNRLKPWESPREDTTADFVSSRCRKTSTTFHGSNAHPHRNIPMRSEWSCGPHP